MCGDRGARGRTEDAEQFGQRREDGFVEAFVAGWLVEEFQVGWEAVAPGAEVCGGLLAVALQGA